MIRTGELAPAALLIPHQLHAAMRADVVERADLVVLAADDHDRGGPHSDIADDPVARIGALPRFRDVQPDPATNPLFRFDTIIRVINNTVDLNRLPTVRTKHVPHGANARQTR